MMSKLQNGGLRTKKIKMAFSCLTATPQNNNRRTEASKKIKWPCHVRLILVKPRQYYVM